MADKMGSEKPVLGFIGGCHVAGYLVENTYSFVDHLSAFFTASQVVKVPYVRIGRLEEHVAPSHKTQSKYVFVQLGNFEFSANWMQILAMTVGVPAFAAAGWTKPSKAATPTPSCTSASPVAAAVAAASGGSWFSRAARRGAEWSKVTIGGILYILTWVLMRKHRQQFHLLNRVIKQNPQSTFVCLSPFPCAAGTHNLLRRLGGRILKHRFDAHPNVRWVDTHRVLKGKRVFFADGIHLNEQGHKTLAVHLQEVCLRASA